MFWCLLPGVLRLGLVPVHQATRSNTSRKTQHHNVVAPCVKYVVVVMWSPHDHNGITYGATCSSYYTVGTTTPDDESGVDKE